MKNKEEQLDKELKAIIKEISLDKPSVDFVAKVMDTIQLPETNYEHQPLLSTKGWWIIASFIIFTGIGLFWMGDNVLSRGVAFGVEQFNTLNLNIPEFNVKEFKWTQSTIIVCLAILISLGIQVGFMSNSYKKTFTS